MTNDKNQKKTSKVNLNLNIKTTITTLIPS